MTDGILERIAAGDPKAVDDCLSTYRGLVWALARRGTNNLADAEDAVQEIFIEIWKHAARFDRSMSSESTYITMIARRRLIDRFRRRKRDLNARSMSADNAEEVASAPGFDKVEVNEEARFVRQKMLELRPEERQILEMSYQLGMSQSEIAAVTDMPLGTVKTHARRGMMRLRELLGLPLKTDSPNTGTPATEKPLGKTEKSSKKVQPSKSATAASRPVNPRSEP